MSLLMTTPRHIAPGAPVPVSLAPAAPPQTQGVVTAKPHDEAPPVIGANDIIFVNGQAFNGRGYPVCGVANQRGRLCGRIGSCPFHSKKNSSAKRPRSGVSAVDASASTSSFSGKVVTQKDTASTIESATPTTKSGEPIPAAHTPIRQMAIPPRRSRFKRSWTTDEHRRFLQAMRRHGKGKWKEIAVEVKTRNANQCQSHAQKYFLRQAKSDSERKKKSIHDVTEADMSKEMPARGAPSLVWPPVGLQGISQGMPSTSPSTNFTSALNGGASGATLASRPATSGVPLAPRIPVERIRNATVVAKGESVVAALNSKCTSQTASLEARLRGPTAPVISTQAVLGNGTDNALISRSNNTNPPIPIVLPVTSLGLQYASMVPSFVGPAIASPGNAAVVPPPPSAKTRVTVHVNGRLKGGMALMLPDSFEDFFEQSRAKLGFEGRFSRVFTRSGGEITDIDEMCQDDTLWLSAGEDFLTPR